MRCELRDDAGDPVQLARELRALVPGPESVRAAVAEILAAVRDRGDQAVAEYTRRFDAPDAPPETLRVGGRELEAALQKLSPAVRAGLEQAIDNVRSVAQAGLHHDRTVALKGYEVVAREAPVDRAAVYVPGGRAPYPSTVVMGVVTADVAGVPDIAVCSPPGRDGEIDRVVLAACRLAGADSVFRMGGAQAVAALVYGTDTVEPVDVIVGPGNLYVQEAKRQLSGQVGIDGFAGPSDLMVLAGAGADPGPLAFDLLAQAEHGTGSLVVGVSTSAAILDALRGPIERAPESEAVACLVQVPDPEQGLALAQAFAPEHLQLAGEEMEELAGRATHAGCVFVGQAAGTAFGDYIAGSNHVLPTGGAARFASALSPRHFRRGFTEVWIGPEAASGLAHAAAPLARAEAFELHARSMEARIRDNGEP